ncbi:PEP-CTERM sorting domain-containing protein [Phragmitibacter flavus]|uniref:PEP-CTERM sorting domain-containing protein n=1 Tax=Phragmitibacter flavus TaxID=2576071 RepID=A0A5R8KHX2_9BACT|nr:PEP-CTERM sorting domain-containing protein [Phragmitibacter flavus]TLD71209.1 PEP-CTERM sorting domain-containing protein [Phragmitibacter flavus]
MYKLWLFSILLILFTRPDAKAQQLEVAFSIQDDLLTWFSVDDPSIQNTISVTGLPPWLEGNALAYDTDNERLLFVHGNTLTNRAIYAVDLSGVTLSASGTVSAGAAVNLGTMSFEGPREVYGGSFYNGSYYVLIDGTDSLRKVSFDAAGTITSQININLPGSRDMFLGDIAFAANGDLWIAGFNQYDGSPADDRLWRFSTADGGNTFDYQQTIEPAGDRYNGIFFDVTGTDLYGYRYNTVINGYGGIDTTTGAPTLIYSGYPFIQGGDLSNGFFIGVEVPEPTSALMVMTGLGCLFGRRRRAQA